MLHNILGAGSLSSIKVLLLVFCHLGEKQYLANSNQIHQKVSILFILVLFLNGQKLIDQFIQNTLSLRTERLHCGYNSGLNLKKKKRINIQEYSELHKKKKIKKARSESILNSCIYLTSNRCILNFIKLCVYWLFLLVENALTL